MSGKPSDFKSPAFQFYPNDFLGSAKVAAMTLEEVGLYTLLLCYDWNEVGLPESPEVLAKLLRISPRTFKKLWRTVGENFTKRGNRYYNKRLDAERRKQLERKQKAADAANQRWHPAEDANALPEALPTQSPSFAVSSSTPIAENNTSPSVADESVPEPARLALRKLLGTARNPQAAAHEIKAYSDGLRPPTPTPEQLGRAVLDFAANGSEWSAAHFRAYVKRAIAEDSPKARAHTPRLSKQEIGRQNLEAAIARRAANNG